MFTERLSGEAKRLGLRAIEIDTAISEDELAERVAGALELQGGQAKSVALDLCFPGGAGGW
jgi:hypothetical protein